IKIRSAMPMAVNSERKNKLSLVFLPWLLIVLAGATSMTPRLASAQTQEQTEALAEAEKLTDQGRTLDAADKYSEAEPFYQRALEIREKILGPEHADTIHSIDRLAWLYYSLRQYPEAVYAVNRV